MMTVSMQVKMYAFTKNPMHILNSLLYTHNVRVCVHVHINNRFRKNIQQII